MGHLLLRSLLAGHKLLSTRRIHPTDEFLYPEAAFIKSCARV